MLLFFHVLSCIYDCPPAENVTEAQPVPPLFSHSQFEPNVLSCKGDGQVIPGMSISSEPIRCSVDGLAAMRFIVPCHQPIAKMCTLQLWSADIRNVHACKEYYIVEHVPHSEFSLAG